jgi:hypothetical protein
LTATERPTRDPRFSPTYPQRVHLKERPALEELLRKWDARIAEASQKFTAVTAGPADESKRKLYFQMLGARDQLAEAVRRLPMETGHLYEEDRLRLKEAVAALERLFKQWDNP